MKKIVTVIMIVSSFTFLIACGSGNPDDAERPTLHVEDIVYPSEALFESTTPVDTVSENNSKYSENVSYEQYTKFLDIINSNNLSNYFRTTGKIGISYKTDDDKSAVYLNYYKDDNGNMVEERYMEDTCGKLFLQDSFPIRADLMCTILPKGFYKDGNIVEEYATWDNLITPDFEDYTLVNVKTEGSTDIYKTYTQFDKYDGEVENSVTDKYYVDRKTNLIRKIDCTYKTVYADDPEAVLYNYTINISPFVNDVPENSILTNDNPCVLTIHDKDGNSTKLNLKKGTLINTEGINGIYLDSQLTKAADISNMDTNADSLEIWVNESYTE